MAGKTNRATAFKIKIVASDTDISLDEARATGPTAAIALPPQMAVPDAIRYEDVRFTFSHLPIKIPDIITLTTENTVKSIPSLPALRASVMCMPKPSPTTEPCSRYLDNFSLTFGKGFSNKNAKISPVNKAIGGVTKDRIQAADKTVKMIFMTGEFMRWNFPANLQISDYNPKEIRLQFPVLFSLPKNEFSTIAKKGCNRR